MMESMGWDHSSRNPLKIAAKGKEKSGSDAGGEDPLEKATRVAFERVKTLKAEDGEGLHVPEDDLSPSFASVGSLFLKGEASKKGFDADDGEGPVEGPMLLHEGEEIAIDVDEEGDFNRE